MTYKQYVSYVFAGYINFFQVRMYVDDSFIWPNFSSFVWYFKHIHTKIYSLLNDMNFRAFHDAFCRFPGKNAHILSIPMLRE